MSQEHLKTMVYAKFGGQTKCIMGNVKMVNERSFVIFSSLNMAALTSRENLLYLIRQTESRSAFQPTFILVLIWFEAVYIGQP